MTMIAFNFEGKTLSDTGNSHKGNYSSLAGAKSRLGMWSHEELSTFKKKI